MAELARLDKTERRYAWIKRRIRTNEEIWKIFPASWHVPYRLCIQFCKKTRYYLLSFRWTFIWPALNYVVVHHIYSDILHFSALEFSKKIRTWQHNIPHSELDSWPPLLFLGDGYITPLLCVNIIENYIKLWICNQHMHNFLLKYLLNI